VAPKNQMQDSKHGESQLLSKCLPDSVRVQELNYAIYKRLLCPPHWIVNCHAGQRCLQDIYVTCTKAANRGQSVICYTTTTAISHIQVQHVCRSWYKNI